MPVQAAGVSRATYSSPPPKGFLVPSRDFRPAIVKDLKDADSYEVIYIGFPVWWYTAPTIINTFIDTYGFKGKTVIFFATSGGSTIDKANAEFKAQYPEIKWKSGKTLNDESKAEIKAWAEGLK